MLRAITACCVRRRTGDSGAAAPLRRARGRGGGGRGGGGGLLSRGRGCSGVLIRGRGYSGGRGRRGRAGGGGSRIAAKRSIPLGYIAPWIECNCLHQPGLGLGPGVMAAAATVLIVLRLVGLVQNEEVSTGREKREKHAEDEKNGEEVKNGENGEDEEMPAH